MSWQLIFTSVPSGLGTGQSGFCTVARHEDMPVRLLRELERASSFSHLALPGSGSEDINPAIASHRLWNLGGTRYHVLSRIQAAGVDFSHRSNHIAHHLVFTEDEIGSVPSPAHILRSWPGWCARWNEEPHFLKAGERGDPTVLEPPLGLPAENWNEATGKPDHAALLVERRRNEKNHCYVVVPLHHPRLARPRRSEELILELFEESLLLLEPAKRWQTRFTTFLQSTDNPAEFVWRGWRKEIPLPADAELGGGLVLDLSNPGAFPEIQDSELAGAARGESPQQDVEERSQLSPPEDRQEEDRLRIVITPRSQPVARPPSFPKQEQHDHEASEHRSTQPVLSFPKQKQRQQKQPVEPESTWPDWLPNRKVLLWIAGGFGVMVMLFIGTWWMKSRPEPQPDKPPQASSKPSPIRDLDKEREEQRDANKKPASLSSERKSEIPIDSSKADKESDAAKAKATPATGQKNVAAKPSEKQSPSQPTAVLSDQQAPIPIYLVMDGDDISGILAKHFGAGINKDTLNARCQLRAKKADGLLPYTFSPKSEAKVFPETGSIISAEDATLLFKLDSQNPSQLAIRVDKDQKTSHWVIRFSSISSDQQSNEAKPQARVDIDVLLCVAGQPPFFKWDADHLIFDKGRLMLGEKTRQYLKPFQLNLRKTQAGTITLWASFVHPETGKTLQLRSSIWDTPPLNYTNLIVDLTPFTQQFEAQLKDLKCSNDVVVIQSTTLEKAIRETRQWLMDDPILNTACSQLFDCVSIRPTPWNKATKWNFKDFWMASRTGKVLPEWGDYCNYLIHVCDTYLALRLGRPLDPKEHTKLTELLWDSQKKAWRDANQLADMGKKLDFVFVIEIKAAPDARLFNVIEQNTNYGKKDKQGNIDRVKEIRTDKRKSYVEEFSNQWDRIFTDRIKYLLYLVRVDELGGYVKRIGDLNKEIQKIEGLKQKLPKKPNDLETVRLTWDVVVEKGKTQSLTLVEFNSSSNPTTTPVPGGTPGPPGGVLAVPSTIRRTR